MDRATRYLNLLRNTHYGLAMPSGAAMNYARTAWGQLTPAVASPPCSFPLVFATITRRCNLHCSFCLWGAPPSDWKDYEMSPEQMEALLATSALQKTLLVMMYGGEPLLNRDIIELVRLTRAHKHLVGLNTNGLLLADAAEDLVEAGLVDVQMSIYDNTFEKLTSVIPQVTHLFPLAIMYTMTSHRLQELGKADFESLFNVIAFCQQAGCASVRIALVWETNNPGTQGETVTDTELYTALITRCKERFPDVVFEGHLSTHHLPTGHFTVFFQSPLATGNPPRTCRRPWLTAVVDAKGNYFPCCAATTPSPVGSLTEEDVDAVINESGITAMRAGLLGPNLPLAPQCEGCPLLDDSYL
ncbi:MAG: radical SAM protein [Coriobacteriia bacterium]|nr:radical SAM protein [Coriobacteriia bacterium]